MILLSLQESRHAHATAPSQESGRSGHARSGVTVCSRESVTERALSRRDVEAAIACLALPFARGGDIEREPSGVAERTQRKPKQIFQPLRVALTGTTVSPGIFETVALLGRDETLARVGHALEA